MLRLETESILSSGTSILREFSVVVPGLFSHPLESDSRLGADLDGGRLRRGHRLLHRLHQVLRVPHQHLSRFNVLVRACNGKGYSRNLRDFSPWAPSIVAFTVERIFSWVPMVGIRSHT